MTERIEQLKQLTSCTWDGNLISKSYRDELVKAGLAARGYGWNWITGKGVEYLVNLGLLKSARIERLPGECSWAWIRRIYQSPNAKGQP